MNTTTTHETEFGRELRFWSDSLLDHMIAVTANGHVAPAGVGVSAMIHALVGNAVRGQAVATGKQLGHVEQASITVDLVDALAARIGALPLAAKPMLKLYDGS